ncbi:MAG TPA: DUF6544 family protein [Polyangiaceae bacterium]
MRIAAALFLVLHGLAHLVGFRAAFWPAPSLPVRGNLFGGLLGVGYFGTRALGIIWLLLALGYVLSAALLLVRSPSWSSVTLSVTGASAIMCLMFWPEARIGLVIDIALFAVALAVSRSGGPYLATAFSRELQQAALPAQPGAAAAVDEATLEKLPLPVRRYMRFMGVVGKPRDWSVRARFAARFRLDRGSWLKCDALQYDTRLQVSRIFCMQLSLKGLLPVTVRDTYVHGRGTMLAKAFDTFTVAKGTGPEIDVGELVTYLNDAILMAPSLLLGPEVSWREVDAGCFDVTLCDGALSVSARVWLDEQGAPRDFSTTDRFFDTPDGKRVRTEWRTPVSGFQDANGRKLPRHAQAVWQLPDGPFAYADFSVDPTQVSFNVPPS